MINKVTIQNFKSIQKLSIDLAGVNVFIGANGSGKSKCEIVGGFRERIYRWTQ